MSSARAIIEIETPQAVFRASLLRKGSRVIAQHPIGGKMEPGRVEEAEDPKFLLKRLSSAGPAFELVSATLGRAGWLRRRENAYMSKVDDYRYFPDMPVREYNVWWDAPNAEWFFKVEGQKKHFGRWCGWHQLQGRAFKSGMELLKWIKMVNPSRVPSDFKVNEAEDPKRFLRTLGTGEAIRTKGDLRRFIAAQIRRMPEKDSDDRAAYPGNTDFLLAWYRQLDTQVMPIIMKALERFYGVQAPNGASALFRTWIKNYQTERRAAQIIASFEEIIADE